MNKQGKGKIEYCDYTWGVITGCRHNCNYCYARRIVQRFGQNYPHGFEPTYWENKLLEPVSRRKPTRIFVGDMGDIMGDWSWKLPAFPVRYVTDCWVINQVIKTVKMCPQHTFLFLTKNPARYAEFRWPQNCWLGTTVTNQADADERIPALLEAKAKLHWASYEPALGPINIVKYLGHMTHECKCGFHETETDLHFANRRFFCPECGTVCTDRPGIGWVAYGPQTGSKRKKAPRMWLDDIAEQCVEAGIPSFLKAAEVLGEIVKDNATLEHVFERKVRELPGGVE